MFHFNFISNNLLILFLNALKTMHWKQMKIWEIHPLECQIQHVAIFCWKKSQEIYSIVFKWLLLNIHPRTLAFRYFAIIAIINIHIIESNSSQLFLKTYYRMCSACLANFTGNIFWTEPSQAKSCWWWGAPAVATSVTVPMFVLYVCAFSIKSHRYIIPFVWIQIIIYQ